MADLSNGGSRVDASDLVNTRKLDGLVIYPAHRLSPEQVRRLHGAWTAQGVGFPKGDPPKILEG